MKKNTHSQNEHMYFSERNELQISIIDDPGHFLFISLATVLMYIICCAYFLQSLTEYSPSSWSAAVCGGNKLFCC